MPLPKLSSVCAGSHVLVRFKHQQGKKWIAIVVPCRVLGVDTPQSAKGQTFGRTQYEVEPIGGKGVAIVSSQRIVKVLVL